ncbi:MAG TPA: efflux RND transporter permease subunit [Ignavibacteriales bacterium]|nr:efflux RND transporter permease subunit [Ignavibacteriales bacterium]
MTITELSIKRPTLVVVVFSVLAVLGIYGYLQLNYDLVPKLTAPVLTIQTIYPGGSPNSVENNVTKVIEDAIIGLEKISEIRSTSSEGFSLVIIQFDMDADIDKALQDAQRKINQVVNKLPSTAKQPVISKLANDELPVLRLTVTSNMDAKELNQFIIDKIQPRLTKIKGVGLVSLLGGEEREIKVNIDANKIKAYKLNLFAVTQTLKGQNLDFPTGNVKSEDEQLVVRVAGKFNSLDEIKNQTIGLSRTGGQIKLKDIAEVYDGTKDLSNIYRLNDNTSIGMLIVKQSDGNTVQVSDDVKKEIERIEKDYEKEGIKFTIAQDSSTFIMDSANAVKFDLFLAVILVALVMFVFLHSIRNSFIVLISIPTSLISVFFLMYLFNFTLNTITLLAMSLVIGILVDDSIVVLENIHRHLEMGEEPRVAALRGRNEIGFAALSITLVDVVVFVPLALITGIIGNLLREYALVVVCSTLMSLFVSFTVTPTLASRISKVEHFNPNSLLGRFSIWFEKQFTKLEELYQKVLRWSLNNPKKIVLGIMIATIFSFALFPMGFIGFEFFPPVDRGEIIVTAELKPGVTIEETNRQVQILEAELRKIPEVNKIVTNVGASGEGIFLTFSKANSSEILVGLVDKKQRKKSTDDLAQDIKLKLSTYPGITVRVAPVSLMGTSGRSPIEILVKGTNYADVLEAGKQIVNIASKIEGTSDVRLSTEEGNPELNINIDRDKLSKFNLTIAEVSQNLRIALTGDDDSKYTMNGTDYNLKIVLDNFDRYNPEDLRRFTFINQLGKPIELQQFANIWITTGPSKLERFDRTAAVTVKSQVFGKTSGVVAQEIMKKLKDVKFNSDVDYELIGEQKNLGDSMKSLLYALFGGILFVYLIMVALYNSYLYPFVVLFSIPLAIVGAFLGLALTMKSIGIFSMLGIITLVGLVAKNAILLVDRTNVMKFEHNLPTMDALLEAGKTRLRPILMTTLSLIFGLLPIALSTSAGSEVKSGLGVVLIGGLSSSLILTLVLVPIVYNTFDRIKEKFPKKIS